MRDIEFQHTVKTVIEKPLKRREHLAKKLQK